MKKYSGITILVNLALLLLYFNFSVVKKEEILKNGQLILLELAPVDPRSLMQGDYMRLRYKIATETNTDSIARRGYCVVRLGHDNVANLVRFQQEKTPLAQGEFLIAYTTPNKWSLEIGAESYLFEEGQGEKYAQAQYGGLMVDHKGNSILTGLYDKDLIVIGYKTPY
ncbi:GDYXXLXY domain-containing protein [Sphingobacterium faecale]|uniref:GDYXXLXY domain-containing protein n=1 Tax=Sphingobacterium faecale TaxID=2803775 RepID=A0ABS1QYN5_9SPHI|nr:GDYXXLXY domain-containing protein [Sphingobacterium faecale]MBL1407185.1 GDYXXLXY domain-containing protein [Sphingobacterium faecale]